MAETLAELEEVRRRLYAQLTKVGDFRRGSLAASYRKCGKKNCACAKAPHPGHLRYMWSTTTKGNRSMAKTIRLGVELEKASEEQKNYQEFQRLLKEVVEVNEKICQLRPLREVADEEELEAMKKKQQRRFAGKRSRK
jgi:uncharacterized protein DUF6788